MHYFNLDDILLLHFKIITDYSGSHGVRSDDRIRSVVAGPEQEAFGSQLYPTLFQKSAVYLRGIIADHPFIDGNKRTAVTVATIFLTRNGRHLTASPEEFEDFAVQVAVERLDVPTIAAWLKSHSKAAG